MKPIVHYNPTTFDVIKVNKSAHIYGGVEDHPKLGRLPGYIITSRVLDIGENREFETENTKYIPHSPEKVKE